MEPSKLIRVSYTLYTVENGEREEMEHAPVDKPYIFVSGLGVNLDAFEKEVVPLANGEKFDFIVDSADAYGSYEEERVVKAPREIFEIDGKLNAEYIYEGAVVPLQNADGVRFMGTIVKIGEKEVTVDLNHPLAGKQLNFVGEIIENRDATNEEIQNMLKILTGEGCGGCGGCSGGCNEGGCESCGKGGCENGCNCG